MPILQAYKQIQIIGINTISFEMVSRPIVSATLIRKGTCPANYGDLNYLESRSCFPTPYCAQSCSTGND